MEEYESFKAPIIFELLQNKENGQKKAQYCQNGGFLNSREEIKLIIEECKRFLKTYKESDIEQINNDIGKKILNCNHNHTVKKKERKKYPGYIYFLQDDSKRIKIGKTQQIDKRVFDIGIKLPVTPILFHFFKTPDTTTMEKYLHDKYKNFRLDGEWFNLPESELLKIKKLQNLKEINK